MNWNVEWLVCDASEVFQICRRCGGLEVVMAFAENVMIVGDWLMADRLFAPSMNPGRNAGAADSETREMNRLTSPLHQLALGALQVEQETLIELRNEHRINDETLRVVQRDVDLAVARLVERER